MEQQSIAWLLSDQRPRGRPFVFVLKAMRRIPSPLYVRLLSGLVKPFPNFDFGFIKPVRKEAVALLRLHAGAHAIDAGCGSGGSFPFLVEAVGPEGKVVGIELSPDSADHARRRAAKNGWRQVEILTASADAVEPTGRFQGLLMFAAPDVYASRPALDNLFLHLAPGARVVLFGSRRSARRFGWLLNGPMNFALTKLSLPTTPKLESEPWHVIAERLRDLRIEERFHGWMFLARGTVAGEDVAIQDANDILPNPSPKPVEE